MLEKIRYNDDGSAEGYDGATGEWRKLNGLSYLYDWNDVIKSEPRIYAKGGYPDKCLLCDDVLKCNGQCDEKEVLESFVGTGASDGIEDVVEATNKMKKEVKNLSEATEKKEPFVPGVGILFGFDDKVESDDFGLMDGRMKAEIDVKKKTVDKNDALKPLIHNILTGKVKADNLGKEIISLEVDVKKENKALQQLIKSILRGKKSVNDIQVEALKFG